MYFKSGEDIWFSAWYFIEKRRPTSLIDFECSYFFQGAGMRLLLNEKLQPRIEMKWPTRPTYYANVNKNAALPNGHWFNLKIHYLLSKDSNGQIQLWLDDQLILDHSGQTLPIDRAIYDRMEVGITANPKSQDTVLFVDDIKVAKHAKGIEK